MKNQYLLIIFLTLSCVLSSCKDEQNSDDKNDDNLQLSDYFFPSDTLKPYVYVYADENRPVDEKFYRIYKLTTPEKEHLVVERYNASFQITEGFTYDLKNQLNVVDHMVVDANGLKRKAKLTKSALFPSNSEGTSTFISDFPAHLDSMMGVYKSKKNVIDTINYSIFDNSTTAIKVKDEVVLSFVNPHTRKGSSNSVEIIRVYAAGFGLTEWYTTDKKIHFKLKRTLSNSWWKENAQGPVVRGEDG